MQKSTAKAESCARNLKDVLSLRGFSVAESKVSGWPKLTLNTAEMSIKIESVDMISKDVFGNDLKAFAPHFVVVAIDENAADSHVKLTKVLVEVAKLGMKVIVKTSAVDLADAEAADGTEVVYDILWPVHGA